MSFLNLMMSTAATAASAATTTMTSTISRSLLPSLLVRTTATPLILQQDRGARKSLKTTKRRTTHPFKWWQKVESKRHEYQTTTENVEFVDQLVTEQREKEKFLGSPVKEELTALLAEKREWTPNSVRVGLIAKKIGIIPYWTKKGKRGLATLLYIPDNHVIKSYTSEQYAKQVIYQKRWHTHNMACMVVGAESRDPREVTAEYAGLFAEAGLLPKKKITSMYVTDDALLPPGTPLSIDHFRVGDWIDVFGKTIDWGFQGVMVRWGFKGMPDLATTKAHRRPGSIACGRRRAGPQKGKKMAGHMGSERRSLVGQRIIRIDRKNNVIFIRGPAVMGYIGAWVNIYDSRVLEKRHKAENPPPFPTYLPHLELAETEEAAKEAGEEERKTEQVDVVIDPAIHNFSDPTIVFVDDESDKKPAIRTGAKLAKVRTKK